MRLTFPFMTKHPAVFCPTPSITGAFLGNIGKLASNVALNVHMKYNTHAHN